ncbi:CDP-alcohol phosphatidyltransferase family protein [Mycoplasmatota bacterium]|nr:CDP-alcohol phosphatidyltransferase family protein [Mycoplasmatota bacterium]
MKKREYITIPNILSVSRAVFLPLLFIFLYNDQRIAFIIGYVTLGLTDFFDGKIARKYNTQTELGMYLDTYADILFFVSSAYFLYILAPTYLTPNLHYLYFTLGVFGIVIITSFIKFKKLLLLHTLLAKICGLLVFVLVILSVVIDTTLLIRIVITVYLLSFTEELLIFFKYGEVDGDTLSYFTAKPISKTTK